MHTPAHKPDAAVQQAIQKLSQVELSPLEEQLFKGWLAANGMEEGKDMDDSMDYRKVYKDSGGKVLPTGQLQKQLEKESAIQTLMKAQEAHEAASPIQQMMEMRGKPDMDSPSPDNSDSYAGME